VRVLVVDSDISKVKAICEALRARFPAPTVWMARNSEVAIKVLSNHRGLQWDLVFLDHDLEMSDALKGRNGQTVASAMRQIGSRAKKVIIQSRNATGADAMHGILHPHYKVVRATFRGTLDMIRAG
jgi:CheY-like chemotaxis protein